MMISEKASRIFEQVIENYHIFDSIDCPFQNPYPDHTLEYLLYRKCWIDTMQWHMEDEVRDPDIEPIVGLEWKRRIDESNQLRTDTVEVIDSYFLRYFSHVSPRKDARINTESPAWALDRLSILCLKIYHMRQETEKRDALPTHVASCMEKLMTLLRQHEDLCRSIDELLEDIRTGRKYMKVYKQMKMYNDAALNPVLYAARK
ncbi:DUF4254 domain-containing protein [Parapedobacter indicus]|uniref:DUF4254 domain-containing protein n=1 Tax=Parapedobacter indicus TaxID=1477437 RepID=A0A1I3PQK8_9SPHI|nr:DUF4254 domain-containing protein [Parapedobacter indicus]PPL00536.1 uncharacterized protein DUF4254 [Parapedobacter indicus]SFJ23749.1 Protein of unknown function [Parapedobacter indicus]